MMTLNRSLITLALGFTALSSSSFAASILAAGTSGGTSVCEVGICPLPDSTNITYGAPNDAATYNFTYTFANGDQYKVTGFYSNSYGPSGTLLDFAPNATYIGNNGNSSVGALGADILALTMYENVFDNSPGSWAGQYCEAFPINVPANVTASAAVAFYGQSIGTITEVGPYTNPATPPSKCANLDFGANDTSAYLESAYTITFAFPAATQPGTGVNTPPTPVPSQVPEPSALFPLLSGSAVLAVVARRLRKRSA